eukprot:CAMPEP_0195307840 /NCGR_PEP_ID=MMETSP0707-20130614/37918_1 /TAXON_ID=33640 /ORGANISM="Asterionellopsis glacialis, Strain CCMP134" /LENGTH=363 /DNA_ID=CAMNT_0040372093 /DNA_START=247 /DNA_END=1338 /DNA_ORIENTATION=-
MPVVVVVLWNLQKRRRSLLLALLIIMLSFGTSKPSSWDEPHPHQGVVPPFEAGDPKVQLDDEALRILASGKPYETQQKSDTGNAGRALVVQDVHVPTTVVWDRILDYNHYAQMVPKTLESQNYAVEKRRHGQQLIYTRMKVGFPLFQMEFFVKHNYQPSQNSLTWTLDYTKRSDFDDSCGYWYIIPHPDNPTQWTRVYYSIGVSMFSWVPKFAVDFMSSKALADATAWVKKHSELEYAKTAGAAAVSKKQRTSPVSNEKKDQDDDNEKLLPTNKRKGPPDWFHRKRRTQKKHPPSQESSSSPRSSSGDDSDASTCPTTDSEGDCTTVPLIEPDKDAPVGVVRVSLLTTVCGLALFNVYLYVSQ